MGVVVFLIFGVTLLMVLAVLPGLSTFIAGYSTQPDTLLYDIVKLFPMFFIGLGIIGALWSMYRM